MYCSLETFGVKLTRRPARSPGTPGSGPRNFLVKPVDKRACAAFVGVVADFGGGHQKDAPFKVVEDDERFGFNEEQVGEAQLVGVTVGQTLVLPNEIVGGVADTARPEVGQVGVRLSAPDGQLPEDAQRVLALEALGSLRGADAHRTAPRLDAAAFAGTDKRIAGDALALFNRLEQKTRVSGDLEVGRQRGLEVG
jgi:hypothetical protein